MPPKRKRRNLLPATSPKPESRIDNRDASPTRYLLKIDSYSSLSSCGINEFESSEFESCGYKWKMIIYPNGDRDGRGHISVCLAIAATSSLPSDWEVNATVSFLLFDQNHDSFTVKGIERRFRNIKTEWCISKFISHATFKEPSSGYLVDDKCVFGVDVYVIKNQLVGECLSSLKVMQPYKHEWKISEFSKLKNVVYSEEFLFGGYKWKLLVLPPVGSIQKGQSISIYLNLVDAKGFDRQKKVLVKFNVSVKDQITGEHSKTLGGQVWYTATTVAGWGWPTFMPLSQFNDPKNGFLVNDCCIVEANISLLGVVNSFTNHILS